MGIDMNDVFPLQYDRWGFRMNGGAIQSFATKEEAILEYEMQCCENEFIKFVFGYKNEKEY